MLREAASPVRTAFANLLEMSLESKLSHDEEKEKETTVQGPKTLSTFPQLDPIAEKHTSVPVAVVVAAAAAAAGKESKSVAETTVASKKPAPVRPVSQTTQSIASLDDSTEYEEEEEEQEESSSESVEPPSLALPSKRKPHESNHKGLDNSLETTVRLDTTMNHLHSNSILETTAGDRLDEKLDGLLSSEKEESQQGGEAEGVAMRVNRTFHKIKELATPYLLPTRLPKPACHPVDHEEVPPAYATKRYPNSPNNLSHDITAITVIDTSHIATVPPSPTPCKPLSAEHQEQQRVPMMRMRNPAVQDFLVEHEETETERPVLKGRQRVKDTSNEPDDILVCNNGLWKGFENFVVTRCGDVADVMVDNAKGNEGGSQYSPECSAASDDEKSEGSASMMQRLSERYLKKDANTVASSLDGTSASNLSLPMALLNPVYKFGIREIPPAPPSSSPPARESNLLADRKFIEHFIHKAQNEGLDILIHRKVRGDDDSLAGPLKAHAYLRDGKQCIGGEFCGPWLVWYTGDIHARKGIDLFDIRSLDKASALQLEQYPLAIPGRSLFLRMNEGSDYVFEMQDETSAIQFVHGMRWLIARLSFNLIIGNVNVSCEMLELDESKIRSRLVESHRNSAMNDLTNHLVDKSSAAM